MNTSPETSAAVKTAVPTLTEADVIDWLRERASSFGVAGLSLTINGGAHDSPVVAYVPKVGASYEWEKEIGVGIAIDDAVTDLRRKLKTPERIAAELYEQAEKLIAQADALTGAKEVAV